MVDFKAVLEAINRKMEETGDDNNPEKIARTAEMDRLTEAITSDKRWVESILSAIHEGAKSFALMTMLAQGNKEQIMQLFKVKATNEAIIALVYLGYEIGKTAERMESEAGYLNKLYGDLNVSTGN